MTSLRDWESSTWGSLRSTFASLRTWKREAVVLRNEFIRGAIEPITFRRRPFENRRSRGGNICGVNQIVCAGWRRTRAHLNVRAGLAGRTIQNKHTPVRLPTSPRPYTGPMFEECEIVNICDIEDYKFIQHCGKYNDRSPLPGSGLGWMWRRTYRNRFDGFPENRYL